MDWSNKSASASTALVMQQTKRGSIILMHDIMPSTATAIPGIVKRLKAQGYQRIDHLDARHHAVDRHGDPGHREAF